MPRLSFRRLHRFARCWLVVSLALVPAVASAQRTALDRYVVADDEAYCWRLIRTDRKNGYTSHVLEMTSQKWRDATEVDRPLWKHWLSIVRPDDAKNETAFLYIGGGSNRSKAPSHASQRVVQLALGSRTAVAELGMVPNQPLFFSDHPNVGRSEDDLVAYSRMKYIKTCDPNWLVRLPMVKSGVRAMDAVQEFLRTDAGGNLAVSQFVVAGGSKRGWTTWLVGLVDTRVAAIIPLVIDALNTEAITRHQYAAYGFFSPALNDYVRHGLYPDKVGTPEYREILEIEDPYHYRHRERLRIPKYIINSAGDQFFTPDNSQFYFHELPEEKHLRYVPNTKHDLAGSDARESVLAFYLSVVEGRTRPKITWKRESAGKVRVATQQQPHAVRLWQASSPKARDFRLDTIGKAYRSRDVSSVSEGEYLVEVSAPDEGFTAFFIEFTYDGPRDLALKFTTDVFVVPDVLPFEGKAPGS